MQRILMAAAVGSLLLSPSPAAAQSTTLDYRFPTAMYLVQPEETRCLPPDHFINEARVTESFGVALTATGEGQSGPLIAGALIGPQNCVTVQVSHVGSTAVSGPGRGLRDGRATVTVRYEIYE